MHLSLSLLSIAACLSASALAAPYNEKRYIGPRQNVNASQQERADAVKKTFQTAWDGYKEFAFPHDELLPVSNGFGDSRYVEAQSENPSTDTNLTFA